MDGAPANDQRKFGFATGGPFRSEHDFNEWQLAQVRAKAPASRRDIYAGLHVEDHRIVFAYGDLAPHNIIVKDGHVNAIIDWEFTGWYPEHWDYGKTLCFLSSTESDYQACKAMYEKQYHAEPFVNLLFGREILHGGS